jgi:hypothetical protein
MLRRTKVVALDFEEYESEAFIQKFDPIRHVLIEKLNDNTITNRALSLAIASFLQFQEEHLGKDVGSLSLTNLNPQKILKTKIS